MRLPRKYLKIKARNRLEKLFSPEPYDYLTVVEVLDSLKKIQSSPTRHKRSLLRCVIDEIFETRKYYSDYSLYQLMKNGHLFGGLIEYGLISNDQDLNEAYNFILDTLKRSPESNVFCFGLMALDRIKHFLLKNREYCSKIASIPHLNVFPTELLEYVNSGKNQQKPDESLKPNITVSLESRKNKKSDNIITKITITDTVTSVSPKSITKDAVKSSKPLMPNSIKELRAERTTVAAIKPPHNDITMIEPPENVQQKISFIFNNMNQENVKKKCMEVKDILKRKYLPWLSVFLTKRICSECQLHSLYLTCLECFNSVPLNELMELETTRNIKVLFTKEKSPQTKILLKNMGHWLGLITLARNRPTPFDLETMVIEAFVKGSDELAFTLPFVAKTLESCSKSKVYGPETPWTLSILNCLAELHQTPGLKLVFQFEIELLCKVLNVELKELSGYKLMNIQ